ncbi:tolloid-like protein 2 isoform X2 [Rhopilema esculentum]
MCWLNRKSSIDVMDRINLTESDEWDFHSTNYSVREVGVNCKSKNPCNSRAMCVDTCHCPGVECLSCSENQNGFHCNRCASNPCHNGGTCLDVSSIMCNCKQGYTGPFCETAIRAASACGSVFKGTAGTIESPDFPHIYPARSQCLWTIYVANDHRIKFRFNFFAVERSSSCHYDYVRIIDGSMADSEFLTGKLCGYALSQTIYNSTTSVASVQFISDGSIQKQGFQLFWMQV